ncbi:hypothetical protein GPJ56_004878 [Histomonas meleagridis]|uniref:uncharacterized protein n=1 Tax=Histomonas meleagridis TaxID=135588 RepID=UPI00355A2F0F|nr:hypothetical protein GPJ56_004878 [Histomonas meleagridis]KAH0803528.1 hypothetical protein GO595_003872 [Histomonas meleagridis]
MSAPIMRVRRFDDERLEKLRKAANVKIGLTDKDMIRDYFLEEEEVEDTWMEVSDQFIETGEEPMEPFSIKEDLKYMHYDKNGNLLPNLNEEEESEADPEEDLITEDKELLLDSLRLLIQFTQGNNTVRDTIADFFERNLEEQANMLTDAACNLMFMGFYDIYAMNERKMGRIYQKIYSEA